MHKPVKSFLTKTNLSLATFFFFKQSTFKIYTENCFSSDLIQDVDAGKM